MNILASARLGIAVTEFPPFFLSHSRSIAILSPLILFSPRPPARSGIRYKVLISSPFFSRYLGLFPRKDYPFLFSGLSSS